MIKIEKTNVFGWEEENGVLVPNFPQYMITRKGEVINRRGKRIKQQVARNGYLRVSLSNSEVKHKWFLVHRLVALSFIPNPNNLPQVNHINRNKADNRVENLEWCTALENLKHSNVIEKATIANFRKIKCLTDGKEYGSIKEVCDLFGVHHSNVVACCNGRRKTCGGMAWQYA